MWETTVDGRVLHFRLWGINNQNFVMRDEHLQRVLMLYWTGAPELIQLGGLRGTRIVMDAHVAEIAAEPAFHERAGRAVQARRGAWVIMLGSWSVEAVTAPPPVTPAGRVDVDGALADSAGGAGAGRARRGSARRSRCGGA